MIASVVALVFSVIAVGDSAAPESPLVPMLDGRIVGGYDTTIEEHPYQLSLEYFGRHVCGASLIKTNAALTAAHCTDGLSAPFLVVHAGSTYRVSGGQKRGVRRICQNPNYTNRVIDYDVAVLILASPFALGPSIQTIPPIPLGVEVPVGALGTITGWGTLYENGALPLTLQKVLVPRVSEANCRVAYGAGSITARMICFGYSQGGKDSCQGDSGGPLVVNGWQAGIVSWGYGCASPKYPGVYTKIAHPAIFGHINRCLA